MAIVLKLSLILLGIGIVAFIVSTAQPGPPADPASIEKIENYIKKLVSNKKPPGLSVAIIKDGHIAYSRAFGWADGPAQLPASTDTVYHWWSMTKVPTALAILQLQDANKLEMG